MDLKELIIYDLFLFFICLNFFLVKNEVAKKPQTRHKSNFGSGETSGVKIKPPDVLDMASEGRRGIMDSSRILV